MGGGSICLRGSISGPQGPIDLGVVALGRDPRALILL